MAHSPHGSSDEHYESELENDSPIEEVRLTVPVGDDPTLPALTFRTWVIGLGSCIILAFLTSFLARRQNPVALSAVPIQIAALPIGMLMAKTLPSALIKVPLTSLSFSLNPGPFNIKEHVLISIFANTGIGGVYNAPTIITYIKAFYHRSISPIAAFLLVMMAQLLGYGWAGIYRKQLIDSPYMWWPSTLSQVPFFSALHEKEKRPRRGLTRLQFFIIVFICSFTYYIFPGYLFPSLSFVSVVCLIWKDSITAQQIGSGFYGLGLGSFTFDWTTISMMGSPLAYPASSLFNSVVGVVLVIYVALPLVYYFNIHNSRRFPFISSDIFDADGNPYNISRILEPKSISINWAAYDSYSKIHMSTFFAMNNFGLNFATVAAIFSHTILFNGKEIWMALTGRDGSKDRQEDIHTRLMRQNYDAVPQWWFHILLVVMVVVSFLACEGFGNYLQLPWWGVLLACGFSIVTLLPIAMIQASTGLGLNVDTFAQLGISYLYPGKPIANSVFMTITSGSQLQALSFLEDFKLGHYMKIPPKSMFITQVVGAVVSAIICFGTTWWVLTSIEHICDPSKLPHGSPWTCPLDRVAFNYDIIWGLVGPMRMIDVYPEMYWFFIAGFLAPLFIWVLTKKFPQKKWLAHVNMPLIIGASGYIPPIRMLNFVSWLFVGLFFNFYVYRKFKGWWSRYAYILSSGLGSGVAILAVLLNITLQHQGIYGPNWWGLGADDHCPLALCPTAPGINVEGCPML